MSVDLGMCYGLNSVGSHIWRLLEDWTTAASICSVLVREYDVAEEVCLAEVRRMLQELADEGLIETQKP